MSLHAQSNDTKVTPATTLAARLAWVDYAKGICIIMVVMMHSTLGVERVLDNQGFMHVVVEFAKPFRIPGFFLISGLFLSRVIDCDWRTYLNRKVLHFVYFYVLWMSIQFAFKAPGFAEEQGWVHVGQMYLMAFIEPLGTLWFIYLLPIFFVVTKASRGFPPLVIWTAAAALETARISTGWTVIDEFTARFVYFYSGYLFAGFVFVLADRTRTQRQFALGMLGGWAIVNGVLTGAGIATWPLLSLALGFAGTCAIIVTGVLLAQRGWLNVLRYCGEHSIVVYLAFFVPMAAMRSLLVQSDVIHDVGVISLIVTTAGVTGALALWWILRGTRFSFLYERPATFIISLKKTMPKLQPAE